MSGPAPVWTPVPGKPWLERNAQGQLRTKLPELPINPNTPLPPLPGRQP